MRIHMATEVQTEFALYGVGICAFYRIYLELLSEYFDLF
jgi:hypothetical protein